MNIIHNLIQMADFEYSCGNFPAAHNHTLEALRALESMPLTPDSPYAMPYLQALTLAQSIATRTHDLTTYAKYEPAVKEWMLKLLGASAMSYYGLHLTEASQCYLLAGDTAMAQQLLEKGISIMENENGPCDLISFIKLCHTAKIHFQLNRYHDCLSSCISAANLCDSDAFIPEDASAFLLQFANNEAMLRQLINANCITAACAFEKINSPEEGIQVLTALMDDGIDDFYTKISAEITLAQLYSRAGNYTEARKIYQQYKNSDFSAYADLNTALSTLAATLETPGNTTQALFAPEYDGQLPDSTCYSKDAFQILLYNNGLKLIAAGQYSQALTLFHQLEERGLSLCLALLAKTGNLHSIPAVKKKADDYFDREIRSLFLYYNEHLVHNHLSLLEHHFSLCMDAYLACHEQLGEQALPAKDIYNFLLNTKYISMEAAYLSRTYQTLEALNERRSFQVEEIQEKLSDSDILMEYCLTRSVTDSYYCVFLISRKDTVCIRLEKQTVIDELITQWHSLMLKSAKAVLLNAEAMEQDKKEIDNLLRRYLYRPVKEYLNEFEPSHIIVSPAGSLVHFPFACMPVSSSSYLGEEYDITYVNTAKEVITNPPLANPALDSALIIGNPLFETFAPLPYAEVEAKVVADCIQGNCYTKEDAKIELFEGCFEQAPSLLHIATHGVFHERIDKSQADTWNTAFEVMERSGLVLAEDYLLSCNMISGMNFSNTFLTVLSACQTGKGLFHSAEGIYGLRRAFRLAGCHSMIISLWQVDDRCGSCFMQQFYRYLTQSNHSAKEAFSLAIEHLRNYTENGIQPFAKPYYWACYIFIE